MKVLRTPDERFADLPGYPFPPHYRDVAADDGTVLRVHHLDEGPVSGPVVLLLHGEPSWSYLYRTMIPVLAEAGLRVIAPDLVGFGRSDKPGEQSDYTYARHVEWMWQLIAGVGVDDITLFAQDWGGLIGLRLVAEHPERFARVMIANTGLPDGQHRMSDAWYQFRDYTQKVAELEIGGLVAGGCASRPPADVVTAYDAPFPDEASKAGARAFPLLIPVTADDPGAIANRTAWEALRHWTKPFLCAFSDGDPITRGGDRPFLNLVPGAEGQAHTTVEGGGHFLQEDKGPEVARLLVRFIAGEG